MKYFFLLLFSINLLANSFLEQYLELQKEFKKQYVQNTQKNIDAYKDIVSKNLRIYRNIVGNIWGKNNVVFSGKKNTVYYSKDYKERTDIDFEKGVVSIQVVSKKKPSAKYFEKKLKKLAKLPLSKGLKKELIFDHLKINMPKKYEYINKDIITTKSVKKPIVSTKILSSGKKEFIFKSKFKKDYLVKLASIYIDQIAKYSKKYKVDRAYILAIIQTESSFKPTSFVSRIPAVGLMQIVPKTGGRDAYKFVYGRDTTPTINYLFNPKNNIELGVAYIHKIQSIYLRGIRNMKKLYLCTSTAYNAGVGNLYKGITNYYSKKRLAIRDINNLSYQRLQKKLSNHRKFSKEAVDYIKKVNKHWSYWKLKIKTVFRENVSS